MRQVHKQKDIHNPKPAELFNTSDSSSIFIIHNKKHGHNYVQLSDLICTRGQEITLKVGGVIERRDYSCKIEEKWTNEWLKVEKD